MSQINPHSRNVFRHGNTDHSVKPKTAPPPATKPAPALVRESASKSVKAAVSNMVSQAAKSVRVTARPVLVAIRRNVNSTFRLQAVREIASVRKAMDGIK